MSLFKKVQWPQQPHNNGQRRPTLVLDQQSLPFIPQVATNPAKGIKSWPKRFVFTLTRWVPILEWLPNYRSRQGFLFDLFAGVTKKKTGQNAHVSTANLSFHPDSLGNYALTAVSTVVIPQSMAYATLAKLPPVYGLYTSVTPILIYAVFGTSKHMSTGAFAVTSLLLGNAVTQIMASIVTTPSLAPVDTVDSTQSSFISLIYSLFNAPASLVLPTDPAYQQAFITLTLALTFIVGLIQLLFGILRVGSLVSDHVLIDPLVTGFSAAAAIHIVSSQLAPLLGIPDAPTEQGIFGLPQLWNHLVHHIGEANVPTVVLGVSALLIMELLRKWERSRRRAALKRAARRLSWRAGDTRWRRTPVLNGQGGADGRKRPSRLMSIGNSSLMSLKAVEESAREEGEGSVIPVSTPTLAPAVLAVVTDDGKTDEMAEQAVVGVPADTAASATDINSNISPKDISTPTTVLQSTNDASSIMESEYEVNFEVDSEPDPDQILSLPTGIDLANVHIPLPDLLATLIVFTLATWLLNLNEANDVDIVGSTPRGFPQFQFPLAPFLNQESATNESAGLTSTSATHFLTPSLIGELFPRALLIAILAYVISLSVAREFAKSFRYAVRPNQELFALGLASALGSCFSAYVPCGIKSTTTVLSQTGSRSQMASLASAAGVVFVLFVLVPAVEAIPICVLAAVVIVTCRGAASHLKDGWRMRAEGRRGESLIFWITFVAALVLNIEWGVLVGIICVMIRAAWGAHRRHIQDREGRGRIPQWRGNREREVEVEWEEGEGWWWRVGKWAARCCGGGHNGRVGERWMRERVVYDEVDDGVVDEEDDEAGGRVRGLA
ncbi:sulfate transporter family-domain-containing protein [Endogone sp. FLAS-F59071]|nr:sulfate transporter family-domain-containing protein [Endogone sp. FLAS-F59071]|eukprot:RUS14344.1 sulfate transporter family-domain-containing protein [Endogone sp. FLAS-F59071]